MTLTTTTTRRFHPLFMSAGASMLIVAGAFGPLAPALAEPRSEPPAPRTGTARIVSLGGALTETLFKLGVGGDVVATDTSSYRPAEAARLPKVGYHRALAAEGILALRPTLVLATDEAGPATALDQLRAAGVTVTIIPAPSDATAARGFATAVGEAVGRGEAGQALAATLTDGFATVDRRVAALGGRPRPKVLLIYARGPSVVNVAGPGTSADAMIRLAGGVNAMTSPGFKPITAEAVIAAAPDVVVMLAKGVESLGGAEPVWTLPGLASTPAARSRRLAVFDDQHLLGFGPTSAAAANELFDALYPAGGVK